MSQEQAERAVESLYEETAARDELDDDEAEILLQWAETQIQRLADQDMDDESFDEAYTQVIRLLTRMNRFAARRADLPLEEQKTFLSRIAESASAVGLVVSETQMDAYLAQPVAQDGSTHIQSLITLVAGGITPQTASEFSESLSTEEEDFNDQEV
jgi:methionyl-tRNA synthetase